LQKHREAVNKRRAMCYAHVAFAQKKNAQINLAVRWIQAFFAEGGRLSAARFPSSLYVVSFIL
jgi:hypothetical protein